MSDKNEKCNDRELLEMASKAIHAPENYANKAYMEGWFSWWNPLENDGDAFRLAVALKLELMFFLGFREVHSAHCAMNGDNKIEPLGVDDFASARRAITRAAAAIGRAM